MMERDQKIDCPCGRFFMWTASEQVFARNHGLQHRPKWCAKCREQRRKGIRSEKNDGVKIRGGTMTKTVGIFAGLAPNIYRTKNEAGILMASLHNETQEHEYEVRVLGEEATPLFESKVRFTSPDKFAWSEEPTNALPFANYNSPMKIEVLGTKTGTILRNVIHMLGLPAGETRGAAAHI
jgi:hypothetical protein